MKIVNKKAKKTTTTTTMTRSLFSPHRLTLIVRLSETARQREVKQSAVKAFLREKKIRGTTDPHSGLLLYRIKHKINLSLCQFPR
jgi:hypothetical protein